MTHLLDKEKKVFSQNGEDGILQFIFESIPSINHFYVELGVGDGSECNTRYLKESFYWKGVWIDYLLTDSCAVYNARVTVENVLEIFGKLSVPKRFGLLSIDLDSNDYWIAARILGSYSPDVIVVEYNGSYPPPECCAVEYDPNLIWSGTDYFGASINAWFKLLSKFGYSLIGAESRGVNAFFIRSECLPSTLRPLTPEEAYVPPRYGLLVGGAFIGHAKDPRRLIKV